MLVSKLSETSHIKVVIETECQHFDTSEGRGGVGHQKGVLGLGKGHVMTYLP